MFTGLKIAAVLSMIGAIVGEYFGGPTNALGVSILNDSQLFDFPSAWAGSSLASAFGIAFYVAVAALERLTTSWHPRRRGVASSDGRSEWRTRPTGRRHRKENAMRRKHAVVALAVLACIGLAAGARRGDRRAEAAEADEGDAAAEVGDAGAVRRLLRGARAGLLQGRPGLDVKIKIGGPSITPETVVVGKQADFGLDWLPNLFATREKGSELVSIAQMFARSGMTELTWKSSGINTIAKMRGKKVGVWCCGNQPELFAALHKNGINPRSRATSRSSTSRST